VLADKPRGLKVRVRAQLTKSRHIDITHDLPAHNGAKPQALTPVAAATSRVREAAGINSQTSECEQVARKRRKRATTKVKGDKRDRPRAKARRKAASKGRKKTAARKGAARKSARKKGRSAASPLPEFIPFATCLLVDRPPNRPDWIHEIRLDGWRLQIRVEEGAATLRTRNGHDYSHTFP
jgi:bifunctional non-homologous end joining protein LigD